MPMTERRFYYEYSCLYKTDAYTDGEPESPATFAHEILHLFGAPDFYEGSSDPYVDAAPHRLCRGSLP